MEDVGLRARRCALYDEYNAELSHYGAVRGHPEETKTWAESFMELPWRWVDIYADDGRLAGFLILGFGLACHPECDVYIAETYLAPDHRGRGLMSAAVKDSLKKNFSRSVALDVLPKNELALAYWPELFREMGWPPCEKTPYPHDEGETIAMYFERGSRLEKNGQLRERALEAAMLY